MINYNSGWRRVWAILAVSFAAQCGRSAIAQAPRTMEPLQREKIPDAETSEVKPSLYIYDPREADKRKQDIAECKANGGIPVPIAGIVSSEGVGCAQPLGGA